MVMSSNGMEETKFLAEKYSRAAVRSLEEAFDDCEERAELVGLADEVINRMS